ncbi:hypothetical protein HOK51_02520 [Candidatus Woesearchaeota archaeon]|jgi:hypothetical protein|nr:hypothetical protein [Candidatus Woesearchaeota archaeon]MBT6518692.1 hypothetical protein [Candidatus Woesearchaeota archaeon]MBT7368386.1 hypothetical protein [Candidatus Woesearchaeota archaeon]
MVEILLAAGCGFFGGVVRALVGILKNGVLFGAEKCDWPRLTFTIIASGVIGVFAGLLISADYRVTMIAGYAGTDLIESVYKGYMNRYSKKK